MNVNLKKTIDKMILTASGWRGIFVEGGDEESRSPEISLSHRFFSAAAALVFSEYLKEKNENGDIEMCFWQLGLNPLKPPSLKSELADCETQKPQ